MNEDLSTLIARLRQSDPTAAEELVAAFEPEIRRFIRFRLGTPQMRRLVESVDVSQSVFAKFFVDLQRDAVCPETPEQLRMLLLTMARNKICDYARRHKAAKRDLRRIDAGDTALDRAFYEEPTASDTVSADEILEAVRSQISENDLALIDARLSGRKWNDLVEEFGGSADALRKRVTRVIDAAAKRLGARV